MHKYSNPGRFPLGLVLFSIGLAIYKAAMLSVEMTGSYTVLLRLLTLDISFLGVLGLLALIHCSVEAAWTRSVLKASLLVMVLFYAIHSFVLLALDENMSLFDLGRYLLEWRLIPGFIDLSIIGAGLVFVLAMVFSLQMSRRLALILLIPCVLIVLAGFGLTARVPFQLQKYALIQTEGLMQRFGESTVASTYTREEHSFYEHALPVSVDYIADDPNIVLLIVESLSSINSFRTSGELDLLQRFDEISHDGVLFPNFFANHSASEGGIIALLSGFPPLHYPGATPLMFDEFAIQPSVINSYRQRGYYTEFLTNADLGFIGLDRYITGLGIDLARGRDEVPILEQAPRIVQNAPSDRFLYDEALATIDSLSSSPRPFLMTIATVSTHLPYTHPEGGEDSAAAVWEWSLEELDRFYQTLVERNFFEHGLLLITGDHRQMRPLTTREVNRYGDSAKARIPLLAIGNGLDAGRIDQRYFQQSDLLRMLGRLAETDRELSAHPLWVERYNRIYGKVDSINRFSVFDPAEHAVNELPVRIKGTELSWLEAKPAFSRQIEATVHAQRSLHQFQRSGGNPGCAPDYRVWDKRASRQNGLWVNAIEGDDLNALANRSNNDGEGQSVSAVSDPVLEVNSTESVLWFRAYLEVERGGLYWFRTAADNRACLGINQQLVLDQFRPGTYTGSLGSIELDAGVHELDLRYLVTGRKPELSLQWVTPGLQRWRWNDVPAGQFRLPLDRVKQPASTD